MVSDPDSIGEGWGEIDELPLEEACSTAASFYKQGKNLKTPNVLHFCQRYGLGEWVWAKMRFTSKFFTCTSPLLKHPPSDIAKMYDYFDPPKAYKDQTETDKRIQYRAENKRVRQAFSMCVMFEAMNEASLFYKQHFCSGVEGTNFDESMELKNIFWTEKNRAYLPVDEGGSLIETPPLLAKEPVINEIHKTVINKANDESNVEYYNNKPQQASNEKQDKYHIVFSTDCSGYQHWYVINFSVASFNISSHFKIL